MNKIDQRILSVFALLAASLVACVYYSSHIQRRNIPAPTIVPIDSQLLIGLHPSFKGDANAPVTLIEFADYQCPACEASWSHVTQELSHYPHRLKLLFHHFPLRIHPQAFSAATAAEAARPQGLFWPMHETLMSSKGQLTEKDIQLYSEKLKLDPMRFQRDRQTSAATTVKADLALSKKFGVKSTPTYFLSMPNGSIYQLGALTQLEEILDKER